MSLTTPLCGGFHTGERAARLKLGSIDLLEADFSRRRAEYRRWGWRKGLPACPHTSFEEGRMRMGHANLKRQDRDTFRRRLEWSRK
jgi:hypothetical protein